MIISMVPYLADKLRPHSVRGILSRKIKNARYTYVGVRKNYVILRVEKVEGSGGIVFMSETTHGEVLYEVILRLL